MGFPGGSDRKESACDAGDLGLTPELGRFPGGRHGNLLQYSCLENPQGQRSLVGYSPRVAKNRREHSSPGSQAWLWAYSWWEQWSRKLRIGWAWAQPFPGPFTQFGFLKSRVLQTLSIKPQIANMFSFASQMVSVATTQFCCSMRAPINNCKWMSTDGRIPINFVNVK